MVNAPIRRRIARALSAAGGLAALTLCASANAQYFLQDLGVGNALALNNSGQVLYSNSISSNGTSAALPAGFIATAINASGQVVGQNAAGHAALFDQGTLTDLGVLPGQNPATDASYATAINAAGEVLGYTVPVGGTQQWFIYSGGVMTGFDSLPGMPAGSRGYGINDLGAITGATGSTADDIFIYDHGVFTNLGGGEGFAINSVGQVTGSLPTPPGHIHAPAFLYSNGQIINLGGVPTGASGAGISINASGQLVGNSYSNDFGAHAFLYNGMMNDLMSLIASTDPLQPFVTLEGAAAINDNGLILATGTDSRAGQGMGHSYLLQAPPLTVSPGSLTFTGNIGVASAPETETVTNVSSAPLVLNSIVASGNSFSQTNNCGTTLAPGASCTVTLTFTATGSGDTPGSLSVTTLGGSVAYNLTGTAPIAVTLASSAASTTVGKPVTLTWTLSPGTSCTKAGGSSADGWTGTTSASGSQSVAEAAAGTFHYALTCTAGSQSGSSQATVGVAWPALTVSLTASPATITSGNSTTLTWTAANAKSCTASGGGTDDGWAGSMRATSGSAVINEPVVLASTLTLTYTLTCANTVTGQSTAASVKVTLNPPAHSGGGGAVDIWSLFSLGAVLLLTWARQKRLTMRAAACATATGYRLRRSAAPSR
jgi:probable HAF family extracellular repeat protein